MDKKKWKVVIVDDEFRIAMLIQKLIHWEDLQMECVAAVNKGVTVLNMIQEEELDIVITDIRMPVVNGFDLINKAKELEKDIRFVVISGYKEFEYAHRALQHGVSDYLLKPINEEELNRVLHKIGEELKKKEEQSLEKKVLEESLSKSKKIIRSNFLKNLIEREHEQVGNEVELTGDIYRGIDIKLDYVDYNRHDEKQDQLTTERITSLVEQNFREVAGDVLICVKENLHMYCMLNYDSSRSKEIKNSISNILSSVKEYLTGFEQYEVSVGIGSEKSDIGEMRFSIREAGSAVGNRIKLGTGRLLYYEAMARDDEAVIEKMKEQLRKSIQGSVENFFGDVLDQAINDAFAPFMLEEDHDYSNCYDIAEDGIRCFFEMLQTRHTGQEQGTEEKELLEKCRHCYSLMQLKKLMKGELLRILDTQRRDVEAKAARPIRKARQYVEEHYGDKITLEDLAELVGLNPVYFSVLFKNETGMNFSAYLAEVRMEHAKDMLCNSNETISVIGQNVGYRDSRYFSQTFTKLVGVKPALYRKLHS